MRRLRQVLAVLGLLWLVVPAAPSAASGARSGATMGTACVLITPSIARIDSTKPGDIFFSRNVTVRVPRKSRVILSDDCDGPVNTDVDDELIAVGPHVDPARPAHRHRWRLRELVPTPPVARIGQRMYHRDLVRDHRLGPVRVQR